ncbi:MAG TPA: purine-nucleoside phosphorylase, partial [Acidimicrobiia bacterium]|nr:purine-nucleoside phosphorylase [Acidimicrobiia bacterium]
MADPTPVLRVTPGEIPERALVVGDPERAERVAARLDDARELGRFREYVTFAGRHRGTEVAVASHGVGAPGAALCFEELHQAGVTRIIRAGTCGGLQHDVADGDLVIATGAIREDGLTSGLVPATFPALATVDVVTALRAAASASGQPVHEGVVLTGAVFYSHDVLGSPLALWAKTGAVA